MNGERIKLARKKAGLSLRALADKMNGKVSAQAIGKYERDEMVPSSAVLLALNTALDVTLPYLMAPQAVKLGEVEFRAKSSTTAKERAKVETAVLEAVERYLQIEEILDLDSAEWQCPKNMPKRISSPEKAEELADELREEWDLGIDPIPNMTELLEQKGYDVVESDLGEFIVQLREEAPYHFVFPAMHLKRDAISHVFHERLGSDETGDPEELTMIARRVLRRKYIEADVGISGANFGMTTVTGACRSLPW